MDFKAIEAAIVPGKTKLLVINFPHVTRLELILLKLFLYVLLFFVIFSFLLIFEMNYSRMQHSLNYFVYFEKTERAHCLRQNFLNRIPVSWPVLFIILF